MRTSRRAARAVLLVAAASLVVQLVGIAPAQAAAPTVLSFLPLTGPPGTSVTIVGLGFDDASTATSVAFNGTAATTFSVDSNLQITATVPVGATTGTIAVADAEGTGTSLLPFTVTAPPAPTVGVFVPLSGPIGTSVTIAGTGFTGATAVRFNGVAATTYSVGSDIQITATVPTGATTGPISVQTAGGTGTSAVPFTVTAAAAPTVASFLPVSGPVGTSVTITGTGFTGATAVTFNGVAASSYTVGSATSITAQVPAGATTGPIAVTTPNGTGASALPLTVTPSPTPTLASFAPTSGPVGTSVTITGTGLTGATGVTFNGLAAASFTVASDTQITATVPTGATTGKIAVTTPGGTATSLTDFTVTASERHARTLRLKLRKARALGRLRAPDGFSDCVDHAKVRIQRRAHGAWKMVGKDTTDANGRFSARIGRRGGTYRALAPKRLLDGGAHICSRAVSPRRHRA
jgi:hypothetical protein